MLAVRFGFTVLIPLVGTLGCITKGRPVCRGDCGSRCEVQLCIDAGDGIADDDAPNQVGSDGGSDSDGNDDDGNQGGNPGNGPGGTPVEPSSGAAGGEAGTGGTSMGGTNGGGASGGVSDGGASDGGSAGAAEGGAGVGGSPDGGAGQGGSSSGGSAGSPSGGAGGGSPVPDCGGATLVEGCVGLCEATCALDDEFCGEPCSILECAENGVFVTTCVSQCEGDVAACGLEAACLDAQGQTCESYGPLFCAPDTPCNPVDSTGGAVVKFCNNVTTSDGGSVELRLDVGGVQLVAPSGECVPLSGPCTSVPGGEAIPYRLWRTTGEVFFQGRMPLEPGTEQLVLADVDADGVYLQSVGFVELSEQVPEVTSCEAFTFETLFPE